MVNLSVGYLCFFNRKAKRESSFVSVRTRPDCTCKFKSQHYSGDNLWLNVDQFTFGGRKETSYVLPDIVEARCSLLSVSGLILRFICRICQLLCILDIVLGLQQLWRTT